MTYLNSPLNYTGSKTKLMNQLVNHFPKEIDGYFIDLFCGGLSVTINTDYDRYISNDIIKPLIEFYKEMKLLSAEDFIKNVLEYKINKNSPESYAELRKLFNETKNPYQLFSLISSCTNNLMRFSQTFKFNQTFGKRSINDSTMSKLVEYHKVLKNKDVIFKNDTFEKIIENNLHKDNFFYFDPPYTSSKEFKIEAGYNCYWSKENEENLWKSLDNINECGAKFAVSNVLYKNNVLNPSYQNFKKWNVIELEFDYDKVSRNKNSSVTEIIIKNY